MEIIIFKVHSFNGAYLIYDLRIDFFSLYAVLASSCNSFPLETKIEMVYYNTEYEITNSVCVMGYLHYFWNKHRIVIIMWLA